MHLAAEAVAGVLEVGDAEAGPAGGVVLVLLDDGGEELAGAVEVVAAAGAGHEGGEDGAGLEILLGEVLVERGEASAVRWFSCGGWRSPKPCRVLKTSLQISDLDGDEVEGGDVDGAAGADALAGDVEELPVEVEAFVGAEEVAGEDEVDEEFFADAEGVELLGGDGHQRA